MVLVFVQVLKYVIILCEKNHVRETKRKKSTLANSKFIISIRSEWGYSGSTLGAGLFQSFIVDENVFSVWIIKMLLWISMN